MTFEEWFEGKAKYLHGDAADLAYAAWQAAFRAGQEDMRERCAAKVDDMRCELVVPCGEDMRDIEIKGE